VTAAPRRELAPACALLPDYLRPGLRVVLVGTILEQCQTERFHYYAGSGNIFWRLLHESGLTPTRLMPEDDETLPSHGIGLTDLVKTVDRSHGRDVTARYPLADFVAKIAEHRPRVVAFTSKAAAEEYARASRLSRPRSFGPVDWTVAGRPVFVLPGPSGANNAMPVPLRVEWWRELADFIDVQQDGG
jgi:TDG/mug DNA glycosylase family protein